MTDTNVAGIAARLVDLEHRKAMLDEQIVDLKAQLLDAVEVGSAVSVGDRVVYRVSPGRKTFSEKKARAALPAELIDAATVEKVDGTRLKKLVPEVLWESCCNVGEPYLKAVR